MKRRLLDLSEFGATDREECGIIVGHTEGKIRVAHRVIKVPNKADDPEDFLLDEDAVEIARQLTPGELVIGILHTHLPHHPAEPSENDLEGAKLNPQFLHAIYKPSTDQLVWFTAKGLTAEAEET